MNMSLTRREMLQVGSAAGIGAVAGCLDIVGLGSDEIEADGYTMFFAIHDWAEQVGGEKMDFANPVGTGRMGHGWSPDADLTADIATTEMFLYLDTPEFSWAQDVAANLERDYDDIVTVDLLEGLEPYLIPFDYDGSDKMPDPDTGRDYPTDSIGNFDIWDLRSQDQLGYWHKTRNHWHGGLPDVVVDRSVPVGIALKDRQGNVVPLGEEHPYSVAAQVVGGDQSAVDIAVDGSTVEIQANAVGEVDIIFEIYHEGELLYDTTADVAALTVVEELNDDGEFYDPHTWVDPIIAQEMVTGIAEELAAHDPDNEESYLENATEYNDRIAAVDEQFQAVIDDAALDVAVFAGHDSYQYVERRYGFELQTPVGVSPDAVASRDDIIGLIETIEQNNIETILFDPFEAPSPGDSYPQIVESILEESPAEKAEPLTPVSGTTEEWEENDWGWVEQMKQINIPSLEQALNPGNA